MALKRTPGISRKCASWVQAAFKKRLARHGFGGRWPRTEKTDYIRHLELPLVPLPCWESLDRHEIRQLARDIIDQIVDETKQRHRDAGTKPMGVRKIVAQNPHALPRTVSRSTAPTFHAATDGVRIAMREAYRAFVDGFRHAADVLRRGLVAPEFPPGSFPPSLPFVPHRPAIG